MKSKTISFLFVLMFSLTLIEPAWAIEERNIFLVVNPNSGLGFEAAEKGRKYLNDYTAEDPLLFVPAEEVRAHDHKYINEKYIEDIALQLIKDEIPEFFRDSHKAYIYTFRRTNDEDQKVDTDDLFFIVGFGAQVIKQNGVDTPIGFLTLKILRPTVKDTTPPYDPHQTFFSGATPPKTVLFELTENEDSDKENLETALYDLLGGAVPSRLYDPHNIEHSRLKRESELEE